MLTFNMQNCALILNQSLFNMKMRGKQKQHAICIASGKMYMSDLTWQDFQSSSKTI